MTTLHRLTCLFALLVLAGCERVIVEGRATNPQGEALPGVVVRLAGTDRQDLSDALGRYRLTASRSQSNIRLQLSKSGYAPSEVEVATRNRLLIPAPEATLWPLPSNPGVYALREHRYIAADWVLPKQYYLKEGSSAFGAELPETLRASAGGEDLYIVCYRTPRYNARLSRLAQAEATVPGLDAEPLQIWVESGTIGAGLEAVDQPAGELLRVVVDRGLEPGVYCLHWGALEGYTTLESRVYAFEIVAPPEPEEEAETEPDGTDNTDAEGDPNDAPSQEAPPTPAQPDLIEPSDELAEP